MRARLKITEIDCAFWDGADRESVYRAMEPVLRDVLRQEFERCPDLYVGPAAHEPDAWQELLHFTADEESGDIYDDYNLLKLWFCGGPEVSPGDWLVWFQDPRDDGAWSFDRVGDEEFRATHELIS